MVLSAMLHFCADVPTPFVRGVCTPGGDATLHCRLHSTFALGHPAFGLPGLFVRMAGVSADRTRLMLLLALAASLT